MSGDIAGDAYAQLIESQLNYERGVKGSFEQRGISVITTSGVLVSLLFGLAAVVTKAETFKLPFAARVLLIVALALFLVAAGLGIGVNIPTAYSEPTTESLGRLTEPNFWKGLPDIGSRRSAELRVNVLRGARRANGTKAGLLLAAMIIEVLAIAVVGSAVIVILTVRT